MPMSKLTAVALSIVKEAEQAAGRNINRRDWATLFFLRVLFANATAETTCLCIT
jgi:hypothetical protein